MAAVTLTNFNNGQTIEVRQGDQIVLRLLESPTTGYRWHIDLASGLSELAAPEHDSPTNQPDPHPVGGKGGIREFRFAATTPGAGRLEMKYWQEWEGDKSAVERFAVDIRIAG